MQAVIGQLGRDDSPFDRSIANNSDRAPNVNDRGRWPARGRPRINDQIERVSDVALDFFGGPGWRHALTIRTGASYRPDSTQEINQRLPGTEADADRAGSGSHRIGNSKRGSKDNRERSGPEGIHQYVCCMGNASHERLQMGSVSDQHENRFSLRPAFDLPQSGESLLIERNHRKSIETFRRQGDHPALPKENR